MQQMFIPRTSIQSISGRYTCHHAPSVERSCFQHHGGLAGISDLPGASPYLHGHWHRPSGDNSCECERACQDYSVPFQKLLINS